MSRKHLRFRIDEGSFEHEGCQGAWWWLGRWSEKGWGRATFRSVKSSLGSMRVRRTSSVSFSMEEFKGKEWIPLWIFYGSYPEFEKIHPTYAMEMGESITFYLEEV